MDTIVVTADYAADGSRKIYLERVPDRILISDELVLNADPEILAFEPNMKRFTFSADNGIAVYEEISMTPELHHFCKLASWKSAI